MANGKANTQTTSKVKHKTRSEADCKINREANSDAINATIYNVFDEAIGKDH